jgi:PII-like signaling protein
VSDESLKLTVYFGESDRVGRHLLSDELLDRFAGAGVKAGVLLRAAEGFGIKHRLHTQRLLTLSEDLPLVAVAVDRRDRIEALVREVEPLVEGGLLTLERTRLVSAAEPPEPGEAAKLTAYLGRAERAGGGPAYVAAVDLLRRHALDGATVLLGVDGVIHSRRSRARFFSRNADVPLMIVASGTGDAVRSVLEPLGGLLADPLVTLERVRVCKRDGLRLGTPAPVAGTDPSGRAVWQKLMVYCGEQSRHAQRPLYSEIVRALRSAGAAGATALRGIWGYHGDHAPHGDSFRQLRRRVPVVTVIVDTPERIERWFAIVDALTDETGLVTSEQVPALRAAGPGIARGGLRLADPGVR